MTQCSPFNYTKSLKKPESKGTEPHNLERQKRKRKRKKKKSVLGSQIFYKDFKTFDTNKIF